MKAKFINWYRVVRQADYLSRVIHRLVNDHQWEAADYVAEYRRRVLYGDIDVP